MNYTEALNEKTCPKSTYKNIPNLFSGSWLPDGDYRTTIKLHSKNDANIVTINYFFRINIGDAKSF